MKKDNNEQKKKITKPIDKKSKKIPSKKEPLFDPTNARLLQELQIHQIELEMQITEIDSVRQKLWESEKKYYDFYDFAPVGYFTVTGSGVIVEANQTAANLLCIEKPSLINSSISDFIYKEDRTKFFALLNTYNGSNKTNQIEIRVSPKERTLLWVELRRALVKGVDAKNLYNIVATDITERKVREQELFESHDKFYKIFYSSSIAKTLVSLKDGKIIEVNDEFLRLVEGGREDVIGYTSAELNAWVSPEKRVALFKELINSGSIRDIEIRFVSRTGRRKVALVSAETITIEGQLCAIYSAQDITKRKLLEEALQKQENLLRLVTNSVPAYMAYLDNSLSYVFVNKPYCDAFGVSAGEIIGKNYKEVFGEEYYKRSIANAEAALAGNYILNEIQITFPVIGKRWVMLHYVPDIDEAKLVRGLFVMAVDITERKLAEDKLLRSQLEYKALFENSGTNIAIIDINGKYLMVSNKASQVFGLAPEKMAGKSVFDFFPSEIAQEYYDLNYNFILQGDKREYERTFLFHGEPKTFLSADQVLQNERGENYAVMLSSIDITERKKVEEELSKLREELEIRVKERTKELRKVNSALKKSEDNLLNTRDQLRALGSHIEKVREEEKLNISREVHDELGHLLTAIKFDLEDLADEHLKDRINPLVDMVDSMVDSVRRISTELRPSILDHLGLIPSLEWQVERFIERTKINCKYNFPKEEMTLSNDQSIVVFRIFQEIMTNIIRHSKASNVIIDIEKTDDLCKLRVVDDGIGFNEDKFSGTQSLGLLGMRERALSIGGELVIESDNIKGTIVTLILNNCCITK